MTEEQVKRKALLNSLIAQLTNNLEDTMTEAALLARYAKVRYDAFVKAGFTPDQAVQLCK